MDCYRHPCSKSFAPAVTKITHTSRTKLVFSAHHSILLYSLFVPGHRKRAVAEVMVKKGSGDVAINNVPLTQYFVKVEDR